MKLGKSSGEQNSKVGMWRFAEVLQGASELNWKLSESGGGVF